MYLENLITLFFRCLISSIPKRSSQKVVGVYTYTSEKHQSYCYLLTSATCVDPPKTLKICVCLSCKPFSSKRFGAILVLHLYIPLQSVRCKNERSPQVSLRAQLGRLRRKGSWVLGGFCIIPNHPDIQLHLLMSYFALLSWNPRA